MEKRASQIKNLGWKVSRIRDVRGYTQKAMAEGLGMSISALGKIETSEEIEEGTLLEIAKFLGVSKDEIKNFNDHTIVFNNNVYEQNNTVINQNYNSTDKLPELLEALLKSEREKNALLEQEIALLKSQLQAKR
jgi:transcriptional regulator with XRE-family HTH domain